MEFRRTDGFYLFAKVPGRIVVMFFLHRSVAVQIGVVGKDKHLFDNFAVRIS